MGTPCLIGVLEEDNSVKCVYCHWDGYLSGVGKILKNHYNNEDLSNRIIKLGDLSSLGSYLNPDKSKPHTFMFPQDRVTVAYHRDRHDDWSDCQPGTYHSAEYYGKHCPLDYCYLYDIFDKCWKVWKGSNFVSY